MYNTILECRLSRYASNSNDSEKSSPQQSLETVIKYAHTDEDLVKIVKYNEVVSHSEMIITLRYNNVSDALTTCSNWNSHVKTRYPLYIIVDGIEPFDPTIWEGHTQHKLYMRHSSEVTMSSTVCIEGKDICINTLPRVSQTDPVCRWMGYGMYDILLIGTSEYRVVWDKTDMFFI